VTRPKYEPATVNEDYDYQLAPQTALAPPGPVYTDLTAHDSSPNPRIDRLELAAIAGGGAIGALARVGLSQAFAPTPGSWPWITFAINLVGAFMLGYFATRLQERLPLSTLRRPLLGTGLCGTLTTFSTVQIEILRMLDDHRDALAGGYIAASVAGGYLMVFIASALVRRVRTIA
jgi:fluoride exporter